MHLVVGDVVDEEALRRLENLQVLSDPFSGHDQQLLVPACTLTPRNKPNSCMVVRLKIVMLNFEIFVLHGSLSQAQKISIINLEVLRRWSAQE